MVYTLLTLHNCGHSFSDKNLFSNVHLTLYAGQKIALMGDNGAGKSVFLKIFAGLMAPSTGHIDEAIGLCKAYVPQMHEGDILKSGAEIFHGSLSAALSQNPDLFLLDEPTNHLDQNNRKALVSMLLRFKGACIVATHDVQFVREFASEIWFLERGKWFVFKGGYDDFMLQRAQKLKNITLEKQALKKEIVHQKDVFERERQRAASSQRRGKKSYDKIMGGLIQMRAQKTSGSIKAKNLERQRKVLETMDDLFIPPEIKPRFIIASGFAPQGKEIVSVTGGSCGYAQRPVLKNIDFSLSMGQHVILVGDNASGKTTFLKALMHDGNIIKTGLWHIGARAVGYLDQHYGMLDLEKTVFDQVRPLSTMDDAALRDYLSGYLLWGADLSKKAFMLSGGERARLCLAMIGLKTPELLILDEMTNNLDGRTIAYILTVLKNYPGTLLVISHDEAFLKVLNTDAVYRIEKGALVLS